MSAAQRHVSPNDRGLAYLAFHYMPSKYRVSGEYQEATTRSRHRIQPMVPTYRSSGSFSERLSSSLDMYSSVNMILTGYRSYPVDASLFVSHEAGGLQCTTGSRRRAHFQCKLPDQRVTGIITHSLMCLSNDQQYPSYPPRCVISVAMCCVVAKRADRCSQSERQTAAIC